MEGRVTVMVIIIIRWYDMWYLYRSAGIGGRVPAKAKSQWSLSWSANNIGVEGAVGCAEF